MTACPSRFFWAVSSCTVKPVGLWDPPSPYYLASFTLANAASETLDEAEVLWGFTETSPLISTGIRAMDDMCASG